MKRSPLLIRAYLRDMPGMSEAKQRERATEAGATVFYGTDEREAWLRALRPGHAAWVWRLSWLAATRTKGGILPIADYVRTISDISIRIGAGAVVIVGDGDVSSEDRAAWRRAVVDGAMQVRSGRLMTKREAKRRGKLGGQIRHERSAANLLRTTHKHKLGLVRAYWRSQEWSTREARAEAINEALEAEGLARLGSWQTIARALGQLDE